MFGTKVVTLLCWYNYFVALFWPCHGLTSEFPWNLGKGMLQAINSVASFYCIFQWNLRTFWCLVSCHAQILLQRDFWKKKNTNIQVYGEGPPTPYTLQYLVCEREREVILFRHGILTCSYVMWAHQKHISLWCNSLTTPNQSLLFG